MILDKLCESDYFDSLEIKIDLFKNKSFSHKLSHQNIHSSFWLIKVKSVHINEVSILDLNLYPFPKPISNFISIYNW